MMQTNIKVNIDDEVNDTNEIVRVKPSIGNNIIMKDPHENIKIEFVESEQQEGEQQEEGEQEEGELDLEAVSNSSLNHSNQKPKRDSIADIIEREKQKNKNEIWSKIDKMSKIQKLNEYADKYGKEQGYSSKNIKSLKAFFV